MLDAMPARMTKRTELLTKLSAVVRCPTIGRQESVENASIS